jgi:hypothetical protein
MKFEIELGFYARLVAGEKARDIIQHMVSTGIIASPKQAWRTLEKWSDAYDYGVSLDLGWLIEGKYPGALLRRQLKQPRQPLPLIDPIKDVGPSHPMTQKQITIKHAKESIKTLNELRSFEGYVDEVLRQIKKGLGIQ